MENRIKEAKDAFRLDQVSFTSMLANQLPLLLTLAAFALLQLLRLRAARTEPARALTGTLRERLFRARGSVPRPPQGGQAEEPEPLGRETM